MGKKLPLEWYQRNRKKYWVIVFLTVGFVIGLPFVIFGIILEIAYQKNRNQLKRTGKDEDESELEELEDKIQLEYKKDKKREKILYACPNCGSRHIKAYRFAPYFLKEYHCEDCDYIGTHVKKIYRKREITHYLCLNCGSRNINPYLGFTGQYRCNDCGYIGLPILEEEKIGRRNRIGNQKRLKGREKTLHSKKDSGLIDSELPEQVEEAEEMLCPNCGEELEEDAMFCPKCGIKIEEEEER